MKSHAIDVLVAGAGSVGLITALFLNKAGVSVTVADAKPGSVTHSYALALHPASLKLLEEVGVAEAIIERAVRVTSVGVYRGGQKMTAVPVARRDTKFPFVAVVGQDVLESVLIKALAERGVAVRWNFRLARFEQKPDSVKVGLDELEESMMGYAAARFDWLVRKSHELEARFLVGADGHESLVRRQLGVQFTEVAPAEHYAVFEFQTSQDLGNEVPLVLHESGLAVLWPLPDNRGRWSFSVDPAQYPDAIREKNHEPVQIIGSGIYPALEEAFFRHLLEERTPWFSAPIDRVYWRMLVRFERRLANSFGSGRVWLAGDAGHLTGPAGIQSMNVGLREGRQLAEIMAKSLQSNGAAKRLAAYASERAEEWRRLLGMKGHLIAARTEASEIAKHGSGLLSCLPASGPELEDMAAGLGLTIAG